ncbi:5690_t:CDS:2 [Scutellospora calospora]|uniref:5690_t:CDS:1 n=1 Tax=Scutellospora calospora TaxID=85575 RepID=A0ACA9L2Y6_9GLOM|nr:5690_t:CDS:2 [Scutellospora calospora]
MEKSQIEESQIEENLMEGSSDYRDTIRKRKNRKNKTSQQHRERRWQQRATKKLETNMSRQNSTDVKMNEHEDDSDLLNINLHLEFSMSLSSDDNLVRSMETENECVDEQNLLNNTNLQQEFDTPQSDDENIFIHTDLLSSYLSEFDQKLLQRFCLKMDKLKHVLCLTCNECFLSIILVKGVCRCCYTKKSLLKKFSSENNMDPGEVSEELQGLTEIEEMLIAQVFPAMIVYRLRGGQHRYSGNIINFPQDVEEFTTRLLRHPSSLNVLIVH